MTRQFLGDVDFTGLLKLNNSAGTAGQVLTSQGAAADPTWTTVSGGGGGSGTVTSITAGTTGLTGGTITTSGTIDIDTTKVPLKTASQTFTGTQTLVSGATGTKALIVKQFSVGTTTPIFEGQTSSGLSLFAFGSANSFGASSYFNTPVLFGGTTYSGSATTNALIGFTGIPSTLAFEVVDSVSDTQTAWMYNNGGLTTQTLTTNTVNKQYTDWTYLVSNFR